MCQVPNQLNLYGVLVSSIDYGKLKRIADAIWGQATGNITLAEAKRIAALSAIECLNSYRLKVQ